jgi:hypothetical protein
MEEWRCSDQLQNPNVLLHMKESGSDWVEEWAGPRWGHGVKRNKETKSVIHLIT